MSVCAVGAKEGQGRSMSFIRKNVFSFIVLTIIVGYIAGDYVSAPLSLATVVKARLGERQVQTHLSRLYKNGGYTLVEIACKMPIERNGFTYTCMTWAGYNGNPHSSEGVYIQTYMTREDAFNALEGVYFWNASKAKDPYYEGHTFKMSSLRVVRQANLVLREKAPE